MTNSEHRRMRQTGCMTFKRVVRTAKRLLKSTGKPVDIYDCGRAASCYKASTKRIADTWCTRQTTLRPSRR